MWTLQLSRTKCHLLVMRLLHPINCSFVLSPNNKRRKTTSCARRAEAVLRANCHLGLFPTFFIEAGLCYCHWQHLCQPSYLLSPPGFLYHRPDGAQSCTHTQNISAAVLKLTTASRIKNKLTSVGYQHTHPCLLLIMPGKSIIISFINPFASSELTQSIHYSFCLPQH